MCDCEKCSRVNRALAGVFRVLRSLAELSPEATDDDVERSGLILGLTSFLATELQGLLPSATAFAGWAREKGIVPPLGVAAPPSGNRSH